LISLEEAVRKMTRLAAETFRLKGHGAIETGARANLVVFDEERVADRATFEESRRYPEGIEFVIVGGQIALEGDRQTDSGSGVAVRMPA
jgi:N-acyl-D-aspartate/D-glutamate deacylase